MVCERFEYGQRFCNKLYNACRFALMNLEGYSAGPLTEGITTLERAIEAAPGSAKAHLNLGIALAQQNRLTDAEEHFRESLRIDPDDAELHYNLGFLLANRGELREAERHLAEAVRLAPNDVANRQALGAIRGRLRANPSR